MTRAVEFDTTLFDAEFFSVVRGARLPVRPRDAVRAGIRAVRRLGESLEFAELRPYQPGDDLRLVDWNAFRRLDRVLVRRYQAERSHDLVVLLDTSASMGVPAERFRRARRLAGAVAVMGAQRNDRVTLITFDTVSRLSVVHSRRDTNATGVLATLSALRSTGQTDVVESLVAAGERVRRGSTLVVLSDLLSPTAIESPLSRLQRNHVRTLFVHVWAVADRTPDLPSVATPIDVETGDETAFLGSRPQLEEHARRFDRHVEATAERVRAAEGEFVSVPLSDPFSQNVLDVARPAGAAW